MALAMRGRVSDPFQPLRAAHNLMPPALPGEYLPEETSNVPLKKYGTPDEVAGAVEGLLSAFSDHMTGVNILHDGGFTRAY